MVKECVILSLEASVAPAEWRAIWWLLGRNPYNHNNELDQISSRLISLEKAAAYCGLSPSGYRAAMRAGRYPGPVKGGRKIDRRALDLAIDKLSGIETAKPVERDEFEEFMSKKRAQWREKYS